jgi:putative CocE/NonD family hydrolase
VKNGLLLAEDDRAVRESLARVLLLEGSSDGLDVLATLHGQLRRAVLEGVYPPGYHVVDGIVRATAVPGEFTELEVDLWSTSYVFRAGHRIRVHVTSSNFPRWDRNLNTGEPSEHGTRSRPARQDVAHDASRPSRIVLPLVPSPVDRPPS